MKPWQAWVVTICSLVSCLVLVFFCVAYLIFVHEVNKLSRAFLDGSGSTADSSDFDARLKRQMEDLRAEKSSGWLPKKPSGEVIVRPPQQ